MKKSTSSIGAGSERSFMRRLVHTPLAALLRGDLGCDREALERSLAEFELPGSIRQLIERITAQSRLWRSEKIEVALELATHFRDGLDAGRPADELINDFGDVADAAKLIRRAKKRNRPLFWRVSKRTIQTVSLILAVAAIAYLALAVRFFTGSPTIAHDYIEQVNAVAASVPEEERAWPHYRSALADIRADEELRRFWSPPESEEERLRIRERLSEHAQALDKVRHAAAMPHLGFVSTQPLAREDLEYFEFRDDALRRDPPLLLGLLLPHLAELRRASNFLKFDARWAMEQGDGERVRDNLLAILGISSHVDEHPLLISQLISYAILAQSLGLLGDTLAGHPTLLSDDDLRRLAHEIVARSGSEPIRIDLSGERMFFADVLQHMFTDDGRGSGRFTPEGAKLLIELDSITSEMHDVSDEFLILTHLAGPAMGVAMADRREMWRTYDEIMSAMEREMAMPLWQTTNRSDQMILGLAKDGWRTKLRYLPVVMLTPAIRKAGTQAEYTTQRRDATQAAIALELYRRRHGHWPQSLAELTPNLLPSMPVDRFDGRPLRYLVRDERVVLYSIGANRQDNGGRPAVGRSGEPEPDAAMRWIHPDQLPHREDIPEGDWILWQSR